MGHHPTVVAPTDRRRGSSTGRSSVVRERHAVGVAHRRAVARSAGRVRQVEQRLPAFRPVEQAGHLGGDLGSLDQCRACGPFPPQPRQHGDPGASACGRRKRGTQNEALGRSRGGFSTKIHIRAEAQGLPLVITLTGGEVHDSKAYDDLMTLGEDDPDAILADKAYDNDSIRADL
jgi:hypothetical protein